MSSLFTSDAQVISQSADYLRGFAPDCILTCILFSSIGYFNGCGKSIPVMVQGITSAFCLRIPVSIFMSKLPQASLILVGLATPITTVYGIIFFKAADLTIEYLTRYRCYDPDALFEMMERGMHAKIQVMCLYPDMTAFAMKAFYEKDPAVCNDIQKSYQEHFNEKAANHEGS